MDVSEALLAVAQVALGLAGFSAVLVALEWRSHHWIVLGLMFASQLYFSRRYTITLQR